MADPTPLSGNLVLTGSVPKMSSLYISEYKALVAYPFFSGSPILTEPPEAVQQVAISGTPALSAAFSQTTRLLREHADAACSIAINAAPVADTTQHRLAAGTTGYLAVTPGHRLSVISNA